MTDAMIFIYITTTCASRYELHHTLAESFSQSPLPEEKRYRDEFWRNIDKVGLFIVIAVIGRQDSIDF